MNNLADAPDNPRTSDDFQGVYPACSPSKWVTDGLEFTPSDTLVALQAYGLNRELNHGDKDSLDTLALAYELHQTSTGYDGGLTPYQCQDTLGALQEDLSFGFHPRDFSNTLLPLSVFATRSPHADDAPFWFVDESSQATPVSALEGAATIPYPVEQSIESYHVQDPSSPNRIYDGINSSLVGVGSGDSILAGTQQPNLPVRDTSGMHQDILSSRSRSQIYPIVFQGSGATLFPGSRNCPIVIEDFGAKDASNTNRQSANFSPAIKRPNAQRARKARRYQCTHTNCPFTADAEKDVFRHLQSKKHRGRQVHTGLTGLRIQDFSCVVAECGYYCSRKDNFARHMLIKHNVTLDEETLARIKHDRDEREED